MFYPDGTSGWSRSMLLQTSYVSHPHITRLELARNRSAFWPEHAKSLSVQAVIPNFRRIGFNALHFGGRLFQQYLVDTAIRVERDRIDWIKFNQKTIMGENYVGVTRPLKDLGSKKDAFVGEKSYTTVIIRRINTLLCWTFWRRLGYCSSPWTPRFLYNSDLQSWLAWI